MAKKLMGGGSGAASRRAAANAAAERVKQEQLLNKERREIATAERGQRINRQGGRGLLAFVDDNLRDILG